MVGSQHMDDAEARIRELLTEAAETHHRVYRMVDGNDPDWASWYADWLINLSELPTLLGRAPVRSELIYLLVILDKDFTAQPREGGWEAFLRVRGLGRARRTMTRCGVAAFATTSREEHSESNSTRDRKLSPVLSGSPLAGRFVYWAAAAGTKPS
jgi:hypothetical protein